MAMAVIHLARPALPPATASSPSLRPRGCVLRLRVRCRAGGTGGDGEGGKGEEEEAPESLFAKEMRRRGMAPGSAPSEEKAGAAEAEEGAQGGEAGRKRGVAAAAEFERAAAGTDGQRERSMGLNSEGLELKETKYKGPGRRSQSAAAGAAATSTTAAAADSSSCGAASAAAPAATSVQSGGSGGSGGYCVGRRLMSHGCVFFGRVFMWCLVAFFCGRDEHSTASAHPPPTGEKPTDGRAGLRTAANTAGAAAPARSAVTGDMFVEMPPLLARAERHERLDLG